MWTFTKSPEFQSNRDQALFSTPTLNRIWFTRHTFDMYVILLYPKQDSTCTCFLCYYLLCSHTIHMYMFFVDYNYYVVTQFMHAVCIYIIYDHAWIMKSMSSNIFSNLSTLSTNTYQPVLLASPLTTWTLSRSMSVVNSFNFNGNFHTGGKFSRTLSWQTVNLCWVSGNVPIDFVSCLPFLLLW